MIISHKNKYIFLEPTGTDAARLACHLFNLGLIDKDDTWSGAGILDAGYFDGMERRKLPDLSKVSYERICDVPLRSDIHAPAEGFGWVLSSSLTETECIKMGLLNKDHGYTVFTVIRHPVDRALALYVNACIRRGKGLNLKDCCLWIEQNDFVHHLWKDQHYFCAESTQLILYEDMDNQFFRVINKLFGSSHVSNQKAICFSEYAAMPEFIKSIPLVHRHILMDRFSQDMKIWQKVRNTSCIV